MIYFFDKNNPNYIAYQWFRDTSKQFIESSDTERLEYVNAFLDKFYEEFSSAPGQSLLESLAAFLLRPYIGNKGLPYKILSTQTLERREQRQTCYVDEMK